jgi:hypothetical protein
MFFLIICFVFVFLFCVFCFLFYVFSFFVLFCVLYLPMYTVEFFSWFTILRTYHGHRVETQLHLVNTISYSEYVSVFLS